VGWAALHASTGGLGGAPLRLVVIVVVLGSRFLLVGGTDILRWGAVTGGVTPVIEFGMAALRMGNVGSCSEFEGAVSAAGGGQLLASPRVSDAIAMVTGLNM